MNRVLYIADLNHEGLLKIGFTTEGRLDARLAELQRQFGADVEIFESAIIPDGWGTAQQWELRLPADRKMHSYEVRPRKDHRGFDLISDALPFGRLWYGEPNAISNAIGFAKFFSRSRDAVIRVYDEAGNVIETCQHAGEFKEP
jgi:hypothetical protein